MKWKYHFEEKDQQGNDKDANNDSEKGGDDQDGDNKDGNDKAYFQTMLKQVDHLIDKGIIYLT